MKLKIWYPPSEVISVSNPEDPEVDVSYLDRSHAESLMSLGYLRGKSFFAPEENLIEVLTLSYPSKMRVTVNGKRVANQEAMEAMVWAFQEAIHNLAHE